jgi:hypothetical protein
MGSRKCKINKAFILKRRGVEAPARGYLVDSTRPAGGGKSFIMTRARRADQNRLS